MLPARHNRFLEKLLIFYVRRLLRRHFRKVFLGGFPGFAEFLRADGNYPLLYFANHPTWWDGFLDLLVWNQFHMDAYLMMDERNLRRLRYFTQTGVFGVDLESQRGRAEGLLYASRLLREAAGRRVLALYPEGRLVPEWEEPQPLRAGVPVLLKRAPGARAMPVWRRIVFSKYQLPDAYIYLGEPFAGPADTGMLRSRLDACAEALDNKLRNHPEAGWVVLLQTHRRLHGNTGVDATSTQTNTL